MTYVYIIHKLNCICILLNKYCVKQNLLNSELIENALVPINKLILLFMLIYFYGTEIINHILSYIKYRFEPQLMQLDFSCTSILFTYNCELFLSTSYKPSRRTYISAVYLLKRFYSILFFINLPVDEAQSYAKYKELSLAAPSGGKWKRERKQRNISVLPPEYTSYIQKSG